MTLYAYQRNNRQQIYCSSEQLSVNGVFALYSLGDRSDFVGISWVENIWIRPTAEFHFWQTSGRVNPQHINEGRLDTLSCSPVSRLGLIKQLQYYIKIFPGLTCTQLLYIPWVWYYNVQEPCRALKMLTLLRISLQFLPHSLPLFGIAGGLRWLWIGNGKPEQRPPQSQHF